MTSQDPAHVLAVVHQNPRRKGERPMCYLGRLAVLAGLLEVEEVGPEPAAGWSSAGEVLEREEGDRYWNR